MPSSNTNFTQNQDTSIIPGIYNLNDPLGVKMNALRNSLSRVLARVQLSILQDYFSMFQKV